MGKTQSVGVAQALDSQARRSPSHRLPSAPGVGQSRFETSKSNGAGARGDLRLRVSTAVPQPIDSSQTISDDANEEAAMIAGQYIRAVYENATTEFIESAEFEALVSGQASSEFVREFVRNVFRTHYLSSHIVALCYASLPSKAAAVLRENLLEEMGRSEDEPPHSALLLKLAEGMGFTADEIESLIDNARRRVTVFSATRVPFSTLREICLAVLIETLSFEFMLSRCSGKIATALSERYGISTAALSW